MEWTATDKRTTGGVKVDAIPLDDLLDRIIALQGVGVDPCHHAPRIGGHAVRFT
jgi:hypothetical protein